MQQSRLKLDHYNLSHLHIELVPDVEAQPLGTYADFEHAAFGSDVEFRQVELPNGEPRHTVELKLNCKPIDGRPFPYLFSIGLVGLFDGRELDDSKRDSLVLVNGASMLYGIAREVMLGLTMRFMQGAVMLPTVQFAELAMDFASVPQSEGRTADDLAGAKSHRARHSE